MKHPQWQEDYYVMRGLLTALPLLLAIVVYVSWLSGSWKLLLLAIAALAALPAGLIAKNRLLERAAQARDLRERRRLATAALVAIMFASVVWCPFLILEDRMGLGEALATYGLTLLAIAVAFVIAFFIGDWLVHWLSGKTAIDIFYERNAPNESRRDRAGA